MTTDVGALDQQAARPHLVRTPSLLVPGAEAVWEEVIRDLLIQEWPVDRTSRPEIVIPNDVPRSARAASSRTQAEVVTVVNAGEDEEYRGHERERVDIKVQINIELIVPGRGRRQRLHDLKACCRDVIYRYAKTLSPSHRLSYQGFDPDYEVVNVHRGTIVVLIEAFALPLFSRRTRGQETPSSDPELFPKGG